jgi:hypothetical protein
LDRWGWFRPWGGWLSPRKIVTFWWVFERFGGFLMAGGTPSSHPLMGFRWNQPSILGYPLFSEKLHMVWSCCRIVAIFHNDSIRLTSIL